MGTYFFESGVLAVLVVIQFVCAGVLVYFFLKHRPLRVMNSFLSNVVSDLNDGVIVFNSFGKIIWANDQAYKLLGVMNINELKPALIERFGDVIHLGGVWTKDVNIPETKGYFILERKTLESNGSFLVIKDRTERHHAVEQEIYDSTHDRLTGLYNMTYLMKRVGELLKEIDTTYCAVFMNIKNFKIVNDVFGSHFGDRALMQMADWLRDNFTEPDIAFGRLIGDTFGIFLPVEKFNEELFMTDLSPFVIQGFKSSYQVCIHIGVYVVNDPTIDPAIMFDRAHMALATISENYKTSLRYYDDDLRGRILQEQSLIADLDEALKNGEIRPYLQPITDITGKIVGAEALARWDHPVLGPLQPSMFIPVFEKNSLIVEVDRHIWDRACQILNRWRGVHDDLFLSINISPKDFYFVDVVGEICSLVERYSISPKNLRIEITETAMMTDSEEKMKIFESFRQEGFIVEMDDFGSGYSSLNMLKDMPVDVLKIDMQFLSGDADKKSRIVLKNVINLSKELDMMALTEGVETKQQLDQLINMGCSLFQGYYFAKPMMEEEFEAFIDQEETKYEKHQN